MTDVSGSGFDEQDQSEVFDEDRVGADDAGAPSGEMRTFEELPEVLDVTQAVGDADDDAARIAEELDDEEIIDLEADAEMADYEDDEIAPRMPEGLDHDEGGAGEVLLDEELGLDNGARAESAGQTDEVELVYAGDLDNVVEELPETELESETLDDDDIEALGYDDAGGVANAGAATGEHVPDGIPRNPTKFDIVLRNHVWALTRDGKPVHEYGHGERAVHEAAELARELRRTGEPAIVLLHPREGKVIEITDNDRPLVLPEEHSAVVPDRSDDA